MEPSLPAKVRTHLDEFVSEVKTLLGPDLRSAILYGSAVRGEFDEKRSDLNLLLVLNQVEFRHLTALAGLAPGWRRRRISTPLVMAPEYIQTAQDVYPMEFLEMKWAYRVLVGNDVLAPIQPSKAAVRRQCEQEIRGKLLHLRKVFLETGLKSSRLEEAMRLSAPAFIRMGRAILFLKGVGIPSRSVDVTSDLRKVSGLELNGLAEVVRWTREGNSLNREGILSLFEAYLSDALSLTRYVDGLPVE